MRTRTIHHAAVPLALSGVLMAAYLLLRPYGDHGGDEDAARVMASSWWVVSHVCGMASLAALARGVLALTPATTGRSGALPGWTAAAGLVLVLPYYGAETFALHVVSRHAVTSDGSSLGLVAEIRQQPVMTAMFGVGLLLLAVGGLSLARAWQSGHPGSWQGWPLGVLVALFLPQFFLPDAGRMAYGVAYLAAAVLFAVEVDIRRRAGERPASVAG